MNFFDSAILSYLNNFSQLSWTFDTSIVQLNGNMLLKGGLFAATLWWGWFRSDKNQWHDREHIISTILSCFVAIGLAKAFALMLPFRFRPIHNVGLNFLLPYGAEKTWLTGWSSFPSDHMVLFCSLSAGLLFISKKIGILAFVYAAVFIGFPKVYLGLHYPTDIIGGAVIGVGIGWLGNLYIYRSNISKLIVRWSHLKPGLFYSLFFLSTFEIAELFNSPRDLLHYLAELFKQVLTKF